MAVLVCLPLPGRVAVAERRSWRKIDFDAHQRQRAFSRQRRRQYCINNLYGNSRNFSYRNFVGVVSKIVVEYRYAEEAAEEAAYDMRYRRDDAHATK